MRPSNLLFSRSLALVDTRQQMPGSTLRGSYWLQLPTCALLVACALVFSASIAGAPAQAAEISWEKALSQALRNHPTAVAAQRAEEQAERGLAKAKGAYLPQLTASSKPWAKGHRKDDNEWENYTEGDVRLTTSIATPIGLSGNAAIFRTWEDTDHPKQSDNPGTIGTSVGLSAALDPEARLYSAANMAMQAARNSLQKAAWERAAQERSVVIDTLATYWQLELDARRVEIAAETAQEAAVEYRRATERHKSGLANQSDVLAAEIALKQAEVALRKAESDYQSRLSSFLTNLGLPAGTVLQPSGGASSDELVRSFDAKALEKAAEANSLSAQKRRLDLEYSRLELKQAQAGLLPDVTVSTSYTVPNIERLDKTKEHTWGVQISVSWPLSDGGRRRLTLKDREAAVKSAEEALARDLNGAVSVLRAKLTEWELARRNVEIAQLKLERAQIDEAMRQQGYNSGLISVSVLNAAKRATRTAEIDLQAAINAQRLVELEICSLTGAPLLVRGKQLLP